MGLHLLKHVTPCHAKFPPPLWFQFQSSTSPFRQVPDAAPWGHCARRSPSAGPSPSWASPHPRHHPPFLSVPRHSSCLPAPAHWSWIPGSVNVEASRVNQNRFVPWLRWRNQPKLCLRSHLESFVSSRLLQTPTKLCKENAIWQRLWIQYKNELSIQQSMTTTIAMNPQHKKNNQMKYVSMCLRVYVRTSVCLSFYVRLSVHPSVSQSVCVRTYVRAYVRMNVCMYPCEYIYNEYRILHNITQVWTFMALWHCIFRPLHVLTIPFTNPFRWF